ncbi:MAG: thioredoxin domain-containing protein [Terriglobia bacterium]
MNSLRPRFPAAACVILTLALGSMAAAQAARPASAKPSAHDQTRQKISDYLRKRFSVSANSTITVGPFEPSIFPDYYKVIITVKEGEQTAFQHFYVSKDGRYLVQGNLYTLGADPFKEVERQISTHNVQSVGPVNAPVTIVEYADLECPVCAQAQDFIEKQLLPKYGNQVRVIFKQFPLVSIHHWALPAAMMNECAFLLDPAHSLTFRSLVYQNQRNIKDATAQDQLLDFAQQAGLDRAKISTCFDAKTTIPRVQEDFDEGQSLGVSTTPTLFINGKMVAGIPASEQFFQIVDQALARAKSKSSAGK